MWDIPVVLIGSQVSINAVKHNFLNVFINKMLFT